GRLVRLPRLPSSRFRVLTPAQAAAKSPFVIIRSQSFIPSDGTGHALYTQWCRYLVTGRDSAMRDVNPPRSIRQAAEELIVPIHTIRSWVVNRKIAHVRLGKSIRIPYSEIQRLLEQGMVPAVRS